MPLPSPRRSGAALMAHLRSDNSPVRTRPQLQPWRRRAFAATSTYSNNKACPVNGDTRPVLCPSAQPDMPDAVAFGVVGGTADEPRVAWIERPIPVSPELLAVAKPVPATQVMRFAATCQERACVHFDGVNCQLATRIVANLPVV